MNNKSVKSCQPDESGQSCSSDKSDRAHQSEDSHDEEGLLTSVWGPSTWEALHCITFGYPKNPTKKDKKYYLMFFRVLTKTLPCCVCREHFTEFVFANDETRLTLDQLESRNTLTAWLFDIHCRVNQSLGVTYDITYQDLCERYGSYIANCEMTAEIKKKSYRNYYNRPAPVILAEYALCFDEYAQKRGLGNFYENVTMYSNLDKKSDEWMQRNNECWEMVKKMRLSATTCVEKEGEFKGLPTMSELELIMRLSSTMPEASIKHVIKKLGHNLVKRYRLKHDKI